MSEQLKQMREIGFVPLCCTSEDEVTQCLLPQLFKGAAFRWQRLRFEPRRLLRCIEKNGPGGLGDAGGAGTVHDRTGQKRCFSRSDLF